MTHPVQTPAPAPRADAHVTMANGAEAAELLLRDLHQRTGHPVRPSDPARLRACESYAHIRTWAADMGIPVIDPTQPPSAELLLAYRSAHGVARRGEGPA